MSENNISKNETQTESPIAHSTPSKSWVQFEDETSENKNSDAAVIPTENVQVLERSFSTPSSPGIDNSNNSKDPKPYKNVELPVATVEPIRQGFGEFILFIFY